MNSAPEPTKIVYKTTNTYHPGTNNDQTDTDQTENQLECDYEANSDTQLNNEEA